jgi:hypothetical protein
VDRHSALVAVSLLATVAAPALVAGKGKKAEQAPKQPPALHVRTIDIPHRLVLIELAGVNKAPANNWFTLTDDRARHYIPQTAHCDPPEATGVRACELEIPDGYERHPLTKLELHLKGLHGRLIGAPLEEVAAAWATAELAHSPAPLLPANVATPPHSPVDAGADGLTPPH